MKAGEKCKSHRTCLLLALRSTRALAKYAKSPNILAFMSTPVNADMHEDAIINRGKIAATATTGSTHYVKGGSTF